MMTVQDTIEVNAQKLHDAINRLQGSWGAVLCEPNPDGPDLADDIQVTVEEIEAGRGAEALRAFMRRWLPDEQVEAA